MPELFRPLRELLMHPHDKESTPRSAGSSGALSPEARAPSAKPELRRETPYQAGDRYRTALIAACCSLAGVGLGVGIGHIAGSADRGPGQVLVWRGMEPGAGLRQARFTWLGVEVQTSSRPQAGAKVTEVVPGSPADWAGLRVGDLITRLDDNVIRDPDDLVAQVHRRVPGAFARIAVVDAEGRARHVEATLSSILAAELEALDK